MSPCPVRRSQAIAPFGVGAMIDFPGPVSLIHCGLDAWPFMERESSHREFMIEDEKRLSERLRVKYFVQPPDYRIPRRGEDATQQNFNLKLPFLRFPRWHVCPRCGRMYESELHDKSAPRCEGPIGSGKDKGKRHNSRKTIQVRFIAACINGHIQDFPWWEWIFRTPSPDIRGLRLRMNTTGSASLAGVRIICEEDSDNINIRNSRTLAGAFNFTPGEASSLSRLEIFCRGDNPALGIPSAMRPSPGCGKDLYPLLRGSSNVYFPQVISAIYLPYRDSKFSDEILEILENPHVWQFLNLMSKSNPDRKISVENTQVVLQEYYPDRKIEPNILMEAANNKIGGKEEYSTERMDSEEQAFKREEYELFLEDIQEGYPKTDLLVRTEDISSYEPSVKNFFETISLVHKLRETRAFVGFSRIFPVDNLTDDQRRALISETPKTWLPAIVIRGEGIFIQIKEEKIQEWLNTNASELEGRLSLLQKTFDQYRERRHQEPLMTTPRFILLHTLAHLMINQLVYECGYGSASVRERIYSSDGKNSMAGILIYTAAGDSEGTMGGLVRMGKPGRLETVLQRALENASWCSTDPVCIESRGQGPDNCNLAACHSCALLPETSCEEQNRLLDRGVLIGTLTNPEIGFFSQDR